MFGIYLKYISLSHRFEAYLGCFGICLRHIFGTWFEVYLGCFGTCLRHILAHSLDAYHGDFEHMIWRCSW
jgi:hypothetical protein